jgi:hypothetical protein
MDSVSDNESVDSLPSSVESIEFCCSPLEFETECADAEAEKVLYRTIQPYMFEPLAPVNETASPSEGEDLAAAEGSESCHCIIL